MTRHFGRLFTTSLFVFCVTGNATAAVPARLPADDWRVGRVDGASGVAVAFSGDGTKLLTAGGDEARVWDARTLRPLTDALEHADAVRAAVISPDGSRTVTAAGREVRLWDVATGHALDTIAHPATVHDAAFSPDGARFVTGCGEYEYGTLNRPKVWEGAAQVWDTATGERLLTLTDREPVRFVGFAPTGKMVFGTAGGADVPRYRRDDTWSYPILRRRELLLWDAATGDQVRHAEVDQWERDRPTFVYGRPAFSPDGTLLAYCCNTAYLAVVIDARDGTVQAYPAERQDESYPAFALATFGPPVHGALRLFVAGAAVGHGGDRAARVVTLGPERNEFGHLKETRVFGIGQHDENVTAGALSPDGRRLALAGHTLVYGEGLPEPGQQRAGAREWAGVWDVASGERLLDTLDGKGDAVLAFSADGQWLAIGYPGAKGQGDVAAPHTTLWRVPQAQRPPLRMVPEVNACAV